MRYVFFDTETTGLNYASGDRVFDIGCVEVIDRKKTGVVFNRLIDPQYKLSEHSKQICQIDDSDLVGKPLFSEIADQFLNFLQGKQETILLAHNAKFDIGFINNELSLANKNSLDTFKILDTLQIARVKFPGAQTSLNALAKKFDINLAEREAKGHGALLDADLLADVFLKMCADDDDNFIASSSQEELLFFGIQKQTKFNLERTFDISTEELLMHNELLEKIKASDIW